MTVHALTGGAFAAKRRVREHLVAHLADYCAAVERFEGIDPGMVPAPKLYIQGPERNPDEIPNIGGPDLFPLVFIGATGIPASGVAVDEPDLRAWEVTYRIRLLWWCQLKVFRAFDEVEAQRDRLELAMRSCLLDKPIIVPGLRMAGSWVGELGETGTDGQQLPTVFGGAQFNVRQIEQLITPPLVDETHIDVLVQQL